MTGHKTIRGYWDSIWQNEVIPKKIEPHEPSIRNYTTRMFHDYFKQVFSSLDTRKLELLEIGCANSVWLPYFNKEFGFNVSGLDYSEIGCDRAGRNLNSSDVKGKVICADLFSPPSHMLGRYDVVVSFGVVEHFEDTSKCLQALSMFLKNDGLLITNIPNMAGFLGFVQKHINRPVFDIHNPLAREEFLNAHEVAGFRVVECEYFMSTNFGVCNLNGVRRKSIKWLMKKIILVLLSRASMLIWVIEERFRVFPISRFFSPYIHCVAKKK